MAPFVALLGASAAFAQSPAPLQIAAPGEAYGLRLEGDELTFCSGDREYVVDLSSPRPVKALAEGACKAARDADPACVSLGPDVDVRTPAGMGDDIVDFPAGSVPLAGHVVDCAGSASAAAVATASRVLAIDPRTAKADIVSALGADHVAIGGAWVVWSRGARIYALKRKGG